MSKFESPRSFDAPVNFHRQLNSPTLLPASWHRRNHVMYEFVCYVNNIVCCELSENKDGARIFVNRARTFIHDALKRSETAFAEGIEYLEVVKLYLDQFENHLAE